MREIRVYVAAPVAPNTVCVLPAAAAKHVARVLRLKPGAPLTLFDGNDGEFAGVIDSVRGGTVTVRVADRSVRSREPALRVTLGQGLARGARMDYAIQKAVELGVDAIAPLATARSVVKLDEDRAESRAEHWREVVVSACEQCGRNRLPSVHRVMPLAEWLAHRAAESSLNLVLDPAAAGGARAHSPPANGQLTLLVGPEGGLEPEEIELAGRHGFARIRLGPRVLRAETAAVAALAALQALWGDLAT